MTHLLDGHNLAFWIALILGIAYHEIGHIVAATYLGVRIHRLGVSWAGPYIVRDKSAPIGEIIIAAMGPFSNLWLALIWDDKPVFVWVNLAIAVINLVPIKGSDGDHILLNVSCLRRRPCE